MPRETKKHSIDGRKAITEIEDLREDRGILINLGEAEQSAGKILFDALDAGVVELKLRDKKKKRKVFRGGNV